MSLVPDADGLSEDHLLLINTAADFAQKELLPLDRAWDQSEGTVYDVLPQLGEMGLLTLCVPEAYGGLECPYRVYAAIAHELAKWSPSTSVTVAVHSMVGRIIHKYANAAIHDLCLSGWSDIRHFGAFALSEAGAGSDAAAVKTMAVESDDGFRISGEKMWITNGMHARWFLTLARMQDAPDSESLCAFLIDGDDPGLQRSLIHGKLGIRGSETAVIHMEQVFVPKDRLLGARGQGLRVCLSSLNEGRIGIAAQACGIAEACLEEMTSYASHREQFGQPIGKFQAIADMLADSAVELEAAKNLIWRAASTVDSGLSDRSECSMAKLYASESANRIAYRAVQVHGGAGFVHECRVEQLFRDARVTPIYEGTSEVQRMVIAAELAKKVG